MADPSGAATIAAVPTEDPFSKVLKTLEALIKTTKEIQTELNTPKTDETAISKTEGGAKKSRRRKIKGGADLNQLMADKSRLTTELLAALESLNESLKPPGTTEGGAKSRRSGSRRKAAGGSAAAVSPAVYNIQGLLSDSHDPANITRDPAIAAMTQLHAPFSAGVIGDSVQSSTNDIAPAAIQRITPMVGMMSPILASQAGGAKKKKAATAATTAAAKKASKKA